MKLMCLIFLLTTSISCKSGQTQDETINWQEYEKIIDSVLHSTPIQDMKLFVKLQNETYKQVFDVTRIEEEKYVSIIKVIITSKIRLYIEEPFSESGDWNNEYVYVFNETGKLKILIRKSSFFNSVCTDKILTEKEIFVNEAGSLIKRDYEIFDENGIVITDTTNCIFNYRFNYPVYTDYFEIPVIKKYRSTLSK